MAAKRSRLRWSCLSRRNAWVATLTSQRKREAKNADPAKNPKVQERAYTNWKEDWGVCRCRRRRGNGNAEWQDGEMMTRAISILQASFDASLGRTIGGAS